jgi:hypothetical protein
VDDDGIIQKICGRDHRQPRLLPGHADNLLLKCVLWRNMMVVLKYLLAPPFNNCTSNDIFVFKFVELLKNFLKQYDGIFLATFSKRQLPFIPVIFGLPPLFRTVLLPSLTRLSNLRSCGVTFFFCVCVFMCREPVRYWSKHVHFFFFFWVPTARKLFSS